MADVTKMGALTIVAAADLAARSHPINKVQSSQANGQAGVGAVVGRLYIRDNGANDYDLALRLPNGTWAIYGRESTVTPA